MRRFSNILFVYFICATGSLFGQQLRQSITGENGKSKHFTVLQTEQQVPFTPANAKNILALDANADLSLTRSETDELGQVHYRYSQTYKGIPVENSMYIMHTTNGRLTGMNGEIILDFAKAGTLSSAPSLSEAVAVSKTLAYVHADIYAWQDTEMLKRNPGIQPSASLVWYSGEGIQPDDLHLAYKIDIYAVKPLSRAYYYIDAKTGSILGKKDELFFSDATGTANTVYSGTQTIHSDYTGSNYRLRDMTKGSGVITLNSGGGDYTNASATWNLSGADQYALDAHYGVSQTYAFYKTNYNRNSINNLGFALTSYVNEASTPDNAYWDGSTMHFGISSYSGGGITAIDVTGHELTHGLTQYTSGLNYSDESGAINESMSDIMGKSVQFWSKPTDVNWLLSNDMAWYIRDMSDPNSYWQPDTYLGNFWYSGPYDNGGVHTNSGIGNFMFYLLVNGGSGVNDIGNAYTVAGIGLIKADAIIYRSETVYLTSTSQYVDWRTACIMAASDLYGGASNELMQVENAWYAVGIGAVSGPMCSGTPNPGTITPSAISICNGSSTTLTLSGFTTGVTGISLQWQSSPNGSTYTDISGANASTYTTTLLSSTTYYKCVVTCSAGGSATSNTSTVTITAQPLIYTVTGGGTFCSGGAGLPVGLSNSQTGVNYQLKNGTNNVGSPVAGNSGNAISFGNQTAAGTYTVVATIVSSSCTQTMSGNAVIVVNVIPVVSISAAGATTVCQGQSVLLNATSTGVGLSYQWKNSGGNINGAINSSYSASSTENYTCFVSNSCGNWTSNSVTVIVVSSIPQATITASGPTTFCTGDSVTLNASPTGGGYTYQWRKDGSNIIGAIASAYIAKKSGDYDVVVWNGCTSVSNVITVTVLGGTVTVTLQPNAANGIDADVYDIHPSTNYGTDIRVKPMAWTEQGVPFVSRALIKFDVSSIPADATVQQAVLTLFQDPTDNGQHSSLSGSNISWLRRVTSPWGENTVTWNTQPSTTTTNQIVVPQSTNAFQDYDIDVTSHVQDMVTNPSTNYGWMLRLQTESYYRCLFFASSDNADPTNWPRLVITYNQTVTATATVSGPTTFCQGDSVTLNALPTGSGVSYQWKLNGDTIRGATSSSYTVTSGGDYTCDVNSICGNATSNAVTITVSTPPSASISATGPTVFCTGGSVTLNALPVGTGYTYQWRNSGVNIGGAIGTSYIVTASGDYDVVVWNGCTDTSNVIPVTVRGGTLTLTLQPNAADGMDAEAFNHPSYVNSNFATSPDFDALAWTFLGTPGVARNFIRFDLSSIPTGAVVQQATFTLYNNPTSGRNGGQHLSLSGSDASWLQRVTGPWNENTITWNNQPGTDATDQVVLPQSTDPHQDYDMDVTKLCQGMVSNPATNYGFMLRLQTESYYRGLIFASSDNADSTKWPKLVVTYSIPFIASASAAGPTTFCQPGAVTLNASPTGGGINYQWLVNGDSIPNATASSYSAISTGNYACIISDTCGSVTSNTIAVTAGTPITAMANASGSTTICIGGSVTLNALPAGTGYTYQWRKNATDISGATNSSYIANAGGDYDVVVSNGCPDTSNIVTVTVLGGTATLTLQPNAANGVDAEVFSHASYTNTNFATVPDFDAIAWTFGGIPGVGRNLIRFDLSSIPTTSTIQHATLTLYNNPTSGRTNGQHSSLSGSNASWLQRITSPWSENTVTWNNQPGTDATDRVVLPQSTSGHEDYDLDVTKLCQGMVTNPATNYGFLLRLQNENYYRCLIFASSDNADSTKWPKLVITYTAAPPVPAAITADGSTTFCEGDSVGLNATPTGSVYSYQWLKNGTIIAGANSSYYAASGAGRYKCAISTVCDTANSNEEVITVDPLAVGGSVLSDTSLCLYDTGDTLRLTGQSGNIVKWEKSTDGGSTYTDIANTSDYLIYTLLNKTTEYRAVIQSGTCPLVSSSPATITVYPSPPIPSLVCSKDTIYASTDTMYVAYQWYKDSTKIDGASDTLLIISSSGNYNLEVTDIYGCNIAVGINVINTGTRNYFNNNDITVYPDPADKIISIRGAALTGNSVVSIYDILGKKNFSRVFEDSSLLSLDIENLAEGVYFVHVTNKEGTWIRRFVKSTGSHY